MYKLRWTAFVLACLVAGAAAAQQVVAVVDHENGVYQIGEPIQFRVQVKGDYADQVKEVTYLIKKNQMTKLRGGKLSLVDRAAIVDVTLDEPGTVFGEFTIQPPPGAPPSAPGPATWNLTSRAGAIAEAGKIKPSLPRPADFDDFWNRKIELIRKIPVNAVLKQEDSGQEGIDYWKLTLDNINGTHVYAQLARPKEGSKLPAVIMFQHAGIYPLPKDPVVKRADGKWLVLNVMAHDLPIDKPEEFYKELKEGPLNNYSGLGNEDRETAYFLRMYLGCYQAIEYMSHRDDWDGKTLFVGGGSQGGQQAIIAAALHTAVTGVFANVPGGCDQTGPLVGRKPGWPFSTTQGAKGKDLAKVQEAGRYFDTVNFAPRVKCPTLIGTGLIDNIVPTAGVLAMYNQLSCPKEIAIMPRGTHIGNHGPYFQRLTAWQSGLRNGKEPWKQSPAPSQGGK
jgi:cephalosporin-C deacetylase